MEQPQIKKTIRSSVQRLKRSSVILLNVILGLILLFHYGRHQQDQQAKHFAGYEAVVRSLQVGDIRPDAFGCIRLPPHLRWLTTDGNVYRSENQTQGKAGEAWLFPTGVAASRLVSGYLYTGESPPDRPRRPSMKPKS
ncbi:MAG: hypothetical protein V4671_00365, partial [Armatimonadota bacterium]